MTTAGLLPSGILAAGLGLLTRLPFLQSNPVTLQRILINIEDAGIATALAAIFQRRLYWRGRLRIVDAESRHAGRKKEKTKGQEKAEANRTVTIIKPHALLSLRQYEFTPRRAWLEYFPELRLNVARATTSRSTAHFHEEVVAMDQESLLKLVSMKMPYGKYQGRLLADLPGHYLS